MITVCQRSIYLYFPRVNEEFMSLTITFKISKIFKFFEVLSIELNFREFQNKTHFYGLTFKPRNCFVR